MPKPKPASPQQRVHSPPALGGFSLVAALLDDVERDNDGEALRGVVMSLLDVVRWEHVSTHVIKTMFEVLMDTKRWAGVVDQQRANAIASRALSEHRDRCACCRANKIEKTIGAS